MVSQIRWHKITFEKSEYFKTTIPTRSKVECTSTIPYNLFIIEMKTLIRPTKNQDFFLKPW
jgi:hypothetical protein